MRPLLHVTPLTPSSASGGLSPRRGEGRVRGLLLRGVLCVLVSISTLLLLLPETAQARETLILTDGTWRCSLKEEPDWTALTFDDSRWTPALVIDPVQFGRYYDPRLWKPPGMAVPIWYPSSDPVGPDVTFCRKTFSLSGLVEGEALLRIQADNNDFELFVNGRHLPKSVAKAVTYDTYGIAAVFYTYDIAQHLQDGSNVIALKGVDTAERKSLYMDTRITTVQTQDLLLQRLLTIQRSLTVLILLILLMILIIMAGMLFSIFQRWGHPGQKKKQSGAFPLSLSALGGLPAFLEELPQQIQKALARLPLLWETVQHQVRTQGGRILWWAVFWTILALACMVGQAYLALGSPLAATVAYTVAMALLAIPLTRAMRRGQWTTVAVILLLSLLYSQAVASRMGKGLTYDEGLLYKTGLDFIRIGHLTTASGSGSILQLSVLPALLVKPLVSGIGFDQEVHLLAPFSTLALSLLLGYGVFRWAAHLYGDVAGLLALSLYVFDPNILAHSRLVTADLVLACFMFLSTYFLWRFLQTRRLTPLLLCGLTFGMAQTCKPTALFLVPLFLYLTAKASLSPPQADSPPHPPFPIPPAQIPPSPFLKGGERGISPPSPTPPLLKGGKGGDLKKGWGEDFFRRWVPLGSVFLIGLLVLNLSYHFHGTGTSLSEQTLGSSALRRLQQIPCFAKVPLPIPVDYIKIIDVIKWMFETNAWGGNAFPYLMGEHRREGWWYYLLIAFVIKTPLPLLLLILLSVLSLIRDRSSPSARMDMMFLLLPAAGLLALSCVFKANLGLRYLLPVYPFFFVLIGRLIPHFPFRLPGVIQFRGANSRRPQGLSSSTIAVLLLLLWHVGESRFIAPHYLAYFNEVIGGPRQGYKYLTGDNIDWWEDTPLIQRYVKSSPVPVQVDPSKDTGIPAVGRIAVNSHDLVGFNPGASKNYRWLRTHFRPTVRVGYSWFVYDIRREDLDRLSRESQDPEIHLGLARAFVRLGEPLRAAEEFRTALSLGAQVPDDVTREIEGPPPERRRP